MKCELQKKPPPINSSVNPKGVLREGKGDAAGTKGHVRGVDVFRVKDGLSSEKLSYVKG